MTSMTLSPLSFEQRQELLAMLRIFQIRAGLTPFPRLLTLQLGADWIQQGAASGARKYIYRHHKSDIRRLLSKVAILITRAITGAVDVDRLQSAVVQVLRAGSTSMRHLNPNKGSYKEIISNPKGSIYTTTMENRPQKP